MAKPTTRLMIEWPILIAVGIIGAIFTLHRLPFYPISNIVGVIIFVFGMIIHMWCHKIHQQADQQSEEIEELVTTGIFSHIRHPMYASLILILLGVTLASGVTLILIPALVLSVFNVLTAMKEEEYLTKKFGDQYKSYMEKVPFRFIPKII